MKTIFGALGAGLIAAVLLASPAEARCAWNGYAWHCWNHNQVRADRKDLRRQRAEVRHDRRHLRHLRAALNRDVNFGSSADIRHDRRALRHARRELRNDRADVRSARRDLRQDRWGY